VKNDGVYIGKRGSKKVFAPDDAKHVFVCGTTGTGKTVALANFIARAVEQDYPLLLVDGKGDTGKGSVLDIVKTLNPSGRKLYIVNLTTPEQSALYNPFADTTPTIAKDMLINLSTWNEEHYKLNAERYLQRVALTIKKAGITSTFKNIVRHLPIDNFKGLSYTLEQNGTIPKQEHAENVEIANTSGKVSDKSHARFALIAESELGHIFDEQGIDIYGAMRERATILFILNPLIYPELSPLIGRMILVDAKKAVSKLFGGETERIFFIFDEINTYASPALINLVNKSRSANITCVLATQSLSDLASAEDVHFQEQVIENCNNYIVLRQNSAVNSENLANILGTRSTMEVTYQMKHENGATVDTGLGSARVVREYLYHPDEIKTLKTGQAFFLSRDTGQHSRILVHKPF